MHAASWFELDLLFLLFHFIYLYAIFLHLRAGWNRFNSKRECVEKEKFEK
jgi:hypothetical protein